ncbi:MAG: hypothetical protein A2V67_01140 [Deltaproteobacteria bacterium RBG_13_61_14]|nr:MAG: hypothetical protein A2V67_01140 [Deltaproteobacteria bacterium RBG_13_61_14]
MSELWNTLGNNLIAVLGAFPHWLVKALVLLGFAGLALAGFFLPKSYIFQDATDRKPWRDLRYWALVVIALEMIPYLFF